MAGVNGAVEAGGALDAELALLLMNHANMHCQQLQKKNPAQAAQLEEPLQQMATYLRHIGRYVTNNPSNVQLNRVCQRDSKQLD